MAKKGAWSEEGHILGKIDIAQWLAKFMGVQFKVYGAAGKVKKGVARAFGMPDKEELEKLSEELDRATGRLNRERGE